MQSTTEPRVLDILEYVESTAGLGLRLFPVQRFILKLYYGLPLGDTEQTITIVDPLGDAGARLFTEAGYLRYLYNEGRCNIREPDHLRNELVLIIGRRGGKSSLSAIISSYEIYRLLNLGNPQKYYGLPDDVTIQVLTISNDKEQAGIIFNDHASHLGRCSYFKPYVSNNTLGNFQFRTPHNIELFGPTDRSANGKFTLLTGKPSLRAAFKSCRDKGLRGYCNASVIFDEMAHFYAEGTDSGKDVYDAACPSTSSFYHGGGPGGEVVWDSRIASLSTPNGKQGKFYDLFSNAMAMGPGYDRILALQIPTWEINPTVPGSFYKHSRQRDPALFYVEFGAQFI